MLLRCVLEYLQSSTHHWYRGKVENFAHFGICNFGAAGLSVRGRGAYRMIGARGRSHALQRHLILILFATKGNTHESAKKIFWLTNSPIIHIRNMLLFFRLKCRLISWSRASLSAIIFLLNWKANLSSTNTKRALSRVSPLNDDQIHFHFFFQTKTHNLKDWKETHDSKHKDSVSPKITKTPKETANMKFLFLFLFLPLSNLTINTCYNNDKGTDNKQIQT